jgi:tRNA A-37 threonylcarbamoyl transferase component Bud32
MAAEALPAADTRGGPPAAQPAPDAPCPERLGRFEIRGLLGRGAFGAVYRAYDAVLEREVALKVPRAELMDRPETRSRFLREPKAAAQLRHPHIVPVYDAGTDGDRLYIASAFIEGRTLAEVIADARLTLREAAQVAFDLAEALYYAHGMGVVHRDVKSANIMVDRRGQCMLTDFGLARIQRTEEKLTHDGVLMGTPAYMAPEQADAAFGAVGPASDQYSLGAVLYEMLCGGTPFEGPAAVVIFNLLNSDPEPPRRRNPGVPPDLETICLKAMARRPADRYADCQDLAEDLRRWLHDEPIRARRMGLFERAAKWARRNPVPAALSAAVAVLALASTLAASGLLVSRQQLVRALDGERQQTERAQSETTRAEEQTRVAREQSRVAQEQRAIAVEQSRLARQREDEAKRQEQIAKQALVDLQREVEARNKAEAAEKAERDQRQQMAGELKKRETEFAESTVAAAEAKQAAEDAGKRALHAEQEQQKVPWLQYMQAVRDAETALGQGNATEAKKLLGSCPAQFRAWEWDYLSAVCRGIQPQETALRIPRFAGSKNRANSGLSPDGSHASAAKKTARLPFSAGSNSYLPATAWTLDMSGIWAFALDRPASAVVFQITTAAKPVCAFPLGLLPSEGIYGVLVAPQGRYLLVKDRNAWYVFDAAQQRALGVVPGVPFAVEPAPFGSLWQTAFSPDGQYALVDGPRFGLMPLANPKTVIELPGGKRSPMVAGFTSQGLLAALTYEKADHAQLTLWRISTRQNQLVPAGSKLLVHPAKTQQGNWKLLFSQNAETMAAVDCCSYEQNSKRQTRRTASIFDLTRGEFCWTTPQTHSFQGLSPDGKRVILASSSGELSLWDSAMPREMLPYRFLAAWAGSALNADWTLAVRNERNRNGPGSGVASSNDCLRIWSMPATTPTVPPRPPRR